jgi:hypothetical protein
MKALAVVAGVVVVIVIAAFVVMTLLGNTDTTLDLNVSGSACAIVTNTADKDVSVQKNKKITWAVKNACPADQTVMLGNFRTVQASTRTTCTDATEGGAAWPFKDDDQNNRSVTVSSGQSGEIVLKEAKNAGSSPLTYYFDICLAGVKSDPRLVIEP